MIQKLTADIFFDCENSPIAGIEQYVMLVNFFDIDRLETKLNTSKTQIIKLVLKQGSRGYIFEGKKQIFTGGQKSIIEKTTRNAFEHSLELRIFNVKDENINQVNKALNGVFVAIVLTKNKHFEVLGFDAGIVAENINRSYNQNQSIFTFSLKSGSVKEQKALYFWNENNFKYMEDTFWSRFTKGRIFDFSFDETFE